jgi:hypothetical protein
VQQSVNLVAVQPSEIEFNWEAKRHCKLCGKRAVHSRRRSVTRSDELNDRVRAVGKLGCGAALHLHPVPALVHHLPIRDRG